jgi:hypothetical protein
MDYSWTGQWHCMGSILRANLSQFIGLHPLPLDCMQVLGAACWGLNNNPSGQAPPGLLCDLELSDSAVPRLVYTWVKSGVAIVACRVRCNLNQDKFIEVEPLIEESIQQSLQLCELIHVL